MSQFSDLADAGVVKNIFLKPHSTVKRWRQPLGSKLGYTAVMAYTSVGLSTPPTPRLHGRTALAADATSIATVGLRHGHIDNPGYY